MPTSSSSIHSTSNVRNSRRAHYASTPGSGLREVRRVALAFVFVLGLGSCAAETPESPSWDRPEGVSVEDHWEQLLQIDDSLERTAALANFATTLGPEDLDGVRELAKGRFRRHRAVDELILMNVWSRLDPESALRAAQITQSPVAEGLRADGMLEWASTKPLEALAFVGIEDTSVRRALVRGWYASGVPGLSDYVLGAGDTRAGQSLVAAYAAELANDQGAPGVARWLDEDVRLNPNVSGAMVIQAHRKGIAEMANADPEAAMAYCDLHCDEEYADAARVRLADRFAVLQMGDRAVRWLAGATDADTEDRGTAARVAFRSWVLKKDDEAALAWADEAFEKHRGEEWFLPVARMVINMRTRRTPERAIDMVDVLPEDDREAALIKIGRRWLELDKEAAEAWLEASPLDEEAREQARTPVQFKRKRPKSAA